MTTAGRTGYRMVLALPGVTPLMTLALLARVPASAAAITLTLHVVLTLDLGYAAAGAVGAASTVGMAIGAPVLGRLVDRRGLRTMLAVTTAARGGVLCGGALPGALVGAFLGGLLAFPVYSIIRQKRSHPRCRRTGAARPARWTPTGYSPPLRSRPARSGCRCSLPGRPAVSSPGCTGRPPRWAGPPAPRWPGCPRR